MQSIRCSCWNLSVGHYISETGDRLSALANKETIKQEDIEFIVNDIGKHFNNTAEISFGKKRISNDRKTKNKKQ